MKYKKSEAKEWARTFYKGLAATILPSFTSDRLILDEAGIRHDVRELIKHGFFSISIVAAEAGTTKDEDKRMIEWCVDEAKGRIGIGVGLRYYSIEDNIEIARWAEKVGCTSLLLSYPTNFHPSSTTDVMEWTRAICEGTNLAVELFPSAKYDFPFPGPIPAQALNQMADISNVVAMKIGVMDWAWIDECFRLFGDKILIDYPVDDGWPVFIRKYGMQWSGQTPWQCLQTPDDPIEVKMFNLFQQGKMDEGMALYWRNDPLRKLVHGFAMSTVPMGIYNFQQWKYSEELVGMTGGEMRAPKLELYRHQKDMIRQTMIRCGFKVVK